MSSPIVQLGEVSASSGRSTSRSQRREGFQPELQRAQAVGQDQPFRGAEDEEPAHESHDGGDGEPGIRKTSRSPAFRTGAEQEDRDDLADELDQDPRGRAGPRSPSPGRPGRRASPGRRSGGASGAGSRPVGWVAARTRKKWPERGGGVGDAAVAEERRRTPRPAAVQMIISVTTPAARGPVDAGASGRWRRAARRSPRARAARPGCSTFMVR